MLYTINLSAINIKCPVHNMICIPGTDLPYCQPRHILFIDSQFQIFILHIFRISRFR